MFIKKCKYSNGRTFLSIVHGFKENGKTKHLTIKKIGYLDELEKEHPNIEQYLSILLQNTTEEFSNTITISNQKLIPNENYIYNLGYVILKKIYNELNLNIFFNSKQSNLNIDYNLNDIFQLLIYSRIMYPGSKKETYDNKNIFFDNFDFSLKDMYRSLDYFNYYKDEILSLLWNQTKDTYNRDTSSVYYDCTNYYFEISYNDEDLIDEEGNILEKGYRKKGPSKEHRPEPIIGLGLLMDKNGIPLSYNLFPGNESEKTTLRPTLKQTKRNFGIERVITVADRGLNTSDNTLFIAGKNDDEHINHDGYVFGQSVRGADQEFKDWVLKQDDYITDKFTENDTEVYFKHKSRIFAKTIQIKRNNVRKNKTQIYQKQMVYYSEKYARKQKKERDLVIAKAKDLIENPGRYTRATSIGAAGYINNYDYDKKTGEIIAKDLSLNLDKINEEEKFDGYYSIVTSELNMSDKEIRDTYKGLWRIEESFKITKSTLETRPVYVWTKEHIEAHFLTCFVSLVILRLLEQKIDRKYSSEKIIDSLKKYNIRKQIANYYQVIDYNIVIDDLSNLFNIDLTNSLLTKKNIQNLLN